MKISMQSVIPIHKVLSFPFFHPNFLLPSLILVSCNIYALKDIWKDVA